MPVLTPWFTCQQATLLIERRADEVLSRTAQVRLWAHLRLCPYCRRYAAQSPFIARQAAAYQVPAEVVLPAAARQRIQQVLDRHLGV